VTESKGHSTERVQPAAYVYILECQGGWLYVATTDNLLRRWAEHSRGGARFTKGRPPVRVIHVEPFATRSEAERRERQLKGWTRRKKLALAAGDLGLLKRL
jgi:predicted GIY-YIG superfamily endonuclease